MQGCLSLEDHFTVIRLPKVCIASCREPTGMIGIRLAPPTRGEAWWGTNGEVFQSCSRFV